MIYTLTDLQKAYSQGKKLHFLFFWGHTPGDSGINASCLSQWWMSDFQVDNVQYCCCEQFMMAEKARLFGDDIMLNNIMAAREPKAMKAYGRQVQNFSQDLWHSRSYDIVKIGNKAKFSQNRELQQFLLSTGNKILVEASPRDRIWGIGMGAKNPNATNPLLWRGTNLLGFALTEVRDTFLHDSQTTKK